MRGNVGTNNQVSLDTVIAENVARASVFDSDLEQNQVIEKTVEEKAEGDLVPFMANVETLPALQEVQYEILADKKKSIFPWRKK